MGGITNVDRLALPEPWRRPGMLDRETMLRQQLPVNIAWWNAEITRLGLPGGPVSGETGTSISRRFILDLNPDEPDADLRRLWHALAWGTGRKPRLGLKRLKAVAADVPAARAALATAGALAHHNPRDAYATLQPGRRYTINYLGSAFFTKFLYFCPGATVEKQAPILDDRVARALRDHGWASLRTGGYWPAMTYERYCRLLTRWANEASAHQGRPVWPDEIERWLFGSAR
ncbi:hypothetical protein AB0F81_43405 [Actinoplanes sp. NPDC024001]|uniref:8-oxoguanine DNA glycosylase OGG fold protein n=1 Tax=Actinoplanes sp. NPDC024001 TaxID=3154598 RepID=UPI0033F39A4E